jgi:Protein of unknown function (DUF1572)
MQEAFTPHYLNDAVRQFRKLKALAERAMAQISDEDLFTALDEEANSIAILLKHMAGSMRVRWTDFPAAADERPDRDRDSEFTVGEADAKRVLIERWEAGWQGLFDALERLTAEDMAKSVLIRGESLSVIEAINRQLTHYAYHVGQIVFLAKHFRSGEWQSLSIPRGKSKEFTTPGPSTP